MLIHMRFVIIFDMFLISSFKMMTCFARAARTTANASNFIYQEKIQIVRNRVFKIMFNFERNKSYFKINFQNCLQNFKSFILIWSETLLTHTNLK